MKKKFIILLSAFLFKNIFAGLLPETVVEVNKNKYKLIKDLKQNDKVVSIDEDSQERSLYQDSIK